MSVFVSDFKAGGGKWTVTHDDALGGSHSAEILPTDVTFGTTMTGGSDHKSMIVKCPVCDSVSTHPIGGGAAPPQVQEMFVRHLMRLGCPCGTLPAGRPPLLALAHARNHVNGLEFVGRWQVPAVVP